MLVQDGSQTIWSRISSFKMLIRSFFKNKFYYLTVSVWNNSFCVFMI